MAPADLRLIIVCCIPGASFRADIALEITVPIKPTEGLRTVYGTTQLTPLGLGPRHSVLVQHESGAAHHPRRAVMRAEIFGVSLPKIPAAIPLEQTEDNSRKIHIREIILNPASITL